MKFMVHFVTSGSASESLRKFLASALFHNYLFTMKILLLDQMILIIHNKYKLLKLMFIYTGEKKQLNDAAYLQLYIFEVTNKCL